MKYNNKTYKIQYKKLILLLILIAAFFTSLVLGVKVLIDSANANASQKKEVAVDNASKICAFVEPEKITLIGKVKKEPEPQVVTPPKVPETVSHGSRVIALTFDDGPGYESTSKILDHLKKYNVKATFFILGMQAERNPDMLRRISQEGHEIASHSYSHPNFNKLDAAAIKNQIDSTQNIVQNITGQTPTNLRPPYGAYNESIKNLTSLHISLWTIDSLDWKLQNSEAIKNQVLNTLTDRGIILFHDIYNPTADAVDQIIPLLQEKGYEFVTISEYNQMQGE